MINVTIPAKQRLLKGLWPLRLKVWSLADLLTKLLIQRLAQVMAQRLIIFIGESFGRESVAKELTGTPIGSGLQMGPVALVTRPEGATQVKQKATNSPSGEKRWDSVCHRLVSFF
jgi:hypothetical protein